MITIMTLLCKCSTCKNISQKHGNGTLYATYIYNNSMIKIISMFSLLKYKKNFSIIMFQYFIERNVLQYYIMCLFISVAFYCRRSDMTVSILAGFLAFTCLGKIF